MTAPTATETPAVASPVTLPPAATRELAGLGERLRVCEVYDQPGAPLYDDLVRDDSLEVRELLTLSRKHPGPVLDLAAGSGRLSFPLLAAGRPVTALELSPSMCELLRARLATAPERIRGGCTVVPGDMRAFRLDEHFAVIVLGTTSVSLLDAEGRADLYRRVREHLAPGGLFLVSTIDLRNPTGTPGDEPSGEESETRQLLTGHSGTAYVLHEHWKPAEGVRTTALHPAELTGAGPVPVGVSAVRALSAERLTAELGTAGLRVTGRHPLSEPDGRHHHTLLTAEVPE